MGPDSPVEVKPVDTDWILVVKGGDEAKVADCMAHIGKLATDHPEYSNINYLDIKRVSSPPERGTGKKKDIYCKYNVTKPVRVAQESEACGINRVERKEQKEMSLEDAKSCIGLPASTQTQLWTKLACVLDATEQSATIQGIDQATYDGLKFQTTLVSEALARNLKLPVPAVLKLAAARAQ